MPWTPTTSGFTRPLGPNEVFIKLVSDPGHALGREHWAPPRYIYGLVGFARSATNFDALQLVTSSFPAPQSSCARGIPNVIYKVPGSTDALNEWASQTFVVKADAPSADDVISTIAPAADAQLYYIPQSSELLLHTAHWRMDGVSGMLLLGQLVDLMTSHADTLLSGKLPDPFEAFDWGSESVRLSPSVEEAGNMPLTATEEHKAIAHGAVGTFALAAGALGVPYTGDASTLPSGTRAAKLKLSPRMTADARAAAKSRGVDITSAVHASLAAVNFRRAIPEHQGRHYTSTIKQSLRPYLPEPYSTPTAAAALFTSGWLVRVDASGTWDENARAHREYASTLVDVIKNLPTPTEPPSDMDISSMGIMEKYLNPEYGTPERGFSILNAGVGVKMLTRQGVVFVWTFRDQLTLRLVYNEAFHTPEQMNEFLKDVQGDLLRELEVTE
ncbi:uncharacterized protein N7483_012316 [Penicillium malachiteum]|uniref:uncharacterized protein n=1 Tax=Penicillium malachiteum TaxID=1324776 RepID=UPI0025466210|nr:uncharacterized protein N7483_012316 [Penicillium malachiteum]KAJ5715135.1 hypothetical protein N7483_012316 [Penicillium malachiteum]